MTCALRQNGAVVKISSGSELFACLITPRKRHKAQRLNMNIDVTNEKNADGELKRAGWRLGPEVFELVDSWANSRGISRENAAAEMIKMASLSAEKNDRSVGENPGSLPPSKMDAPKDISAPLMPAGLPLDMDRFSDIAAELKAALDSARFGRLTYLIGQLDEFSRKHREIVEKNIRDLGLSQGSLSKAIAEFSELSKGAVEARSDVKKLTDEGFSSLEKLFAESRANMTQVSSDFGEKIASLGEAVSQVKKEILGEMVGVREVISGQYKKIAAAVCQAQDSADSIKFVSEELRAAASTNHRELSRLADGLKIDVGFFRNKAIATAIVGCAIVVTLAVTTSLFFVPEWNRLKAEEMARTEIKEMMQSHLDNMDQKFNEHFKLVAESQDEKLKKYFEAESARFEDFKRKNIADLAKAKSEATEAKKHAAEWKDEAIDYYNKYEATKKNHCGVISGGSSGGSSAGLVFLLLPLFGMAFLSLKRRLFHDHH